MPKPALEFFRPDDVPWTPVEDLGLGRTFTAGMDACRPPGMRHGPYASPRGALLFETRDRR